MASGIYEEIWKLLKRYKFDIDFQINNDLLCSLCNKILINATVGPCDCKYCHQCIENYLNGEEKFCPTQKIACMKQVISLKNDLKIDNIINRKISLLEVKCPKTFCQFTDELKNISSHLISHQSKCEFLEIGCVESRNHLDNNNSLHLNLLMNTLQNLKNEMEISKEKCSKNEDLINTLNMELIQMKEENNSLKSQLMIQETLNENHILVNNQIITKLNGLENHVGEIKNYTFKSKILQPAPYKYKINNFLNRINSSSECIHTDKFLSEPCGYTMRLKIYLRGKGTDLNQNLTVEFGIVEGIYDDELPWPMKRNVVITVMNQYTNEEHVTNIFHFNGVDKSLKCIFFKPSERRKDEDKFFLGTKNLISIHELTNNAYLNVNNSIVVQCFVD